MRRWLRWLPLGLLVIGLLGTGWYIYDICCMPVDLEAEETTSTTIVTTTRRETTTTAGPTTTHSWETTTTLPSQSPGDGVTVSEGHRYHLSSDLEFDVEVFQPPDFDGSLRPALAFMGNDPGSGVIEILSGVADQGVVVFAATWRAFPLDDPGGMLAGIEDASCLLRFIAAQGPAFGADPQRVTIAGHGLAGLVGLVAAVDPEAIEATDPNVCAFPGPPAHPGGSLVLGSEDLPATAEGYPPVLEAVYDPAAAADRPLRIRFDLASTEDVEERREVADRLAEALGDAGHDTAVVLFPLSLDLSYRVNVIMEATRW